MVHVRLNEHEANPNPHVNFITPLKMADPDSEEEARQLLRALAAQVRPIMKAHGFVVNSLEEYEHNQVFAGRNWNNGEVVELVLRGASGGFLPTSWLLSTLCHELAHIKHMNHGPAFQALWTKLRNEVKELQRKGYYGDGYWSSGSRLADSARVGGRGLESGDLPEYMCGGAQSRTRTTAHRRRRRQGGASSHTGAQTAKKRKPGSRVTAKDAFKGAGRALNEEAEDEEQKKHGTGFRKKAGSKRAREERALAAERRLLVLHSQAGAGPAIKHGPEDEDSTSDSEYEDAPETDQDRRRAMLDSADGSELDGLKAWQNDYSSDFIFPPVSGPSTHSGSPKPWKDDDAKPRAGSSKGKHRDLDVIELSSDEDNDAAGGCNVHNLPRGGTAATSSVSSERRSNDDTSSSAAGRSQSRLASWLRSDASPGTATMGKQKLSYGNLVQDEIRNRKKESLGMEKPGRRLGDTPSGSRHGGNPAQSEQHRRRPAEFEGEGEPEISHGSSPTANDTWTCRVCTLLNEPSHLACSACTTPRGESVWAGNAANSFLR